MKLYIDDKEAVVRDSIDLEGILRRNDRHKEKFHLKNTKSGITLKAHYVFDVEDSSTGEDISIYWIGYSTKEEKAEYSAITGWSESGQIEGVVRFSVSFYNDDDQWKNLCEWDKESPRDTLIGLLLFFGFCGLVAGSFAFAAWAFDLMMEGF